MQNERGRVNQSKRTRERETMSAVWTAVKKSLHCKSNTSEVYEPKPRSTKSRCCKPKPGAVAASTSCKSSMKDVIHGKKRLKGNSTNCSPLSIRSSDLINPVTHHVRFTNSQLKITKDHAHHHNAGGSPLAGFLGSPAIRLSSSFPRIASGLRPDQVAGSSYRRRTSMAESSAGGPFRQTCHKCGEPLVRQDAEEHYLTKHAVTEVLEGDSTRKIIEMIFMTGWTSSVNRGRIERILKVHNPQTKLAQFEEYREMVKIRANRLQYSKKHPRCLADGNELLRFYGTTLACRLGRNGSSSLCFLQTCNVCCILRHGFASQKGIDQSVLGIFTTSTSERAHKSIEIDGEGGPNANKALRKALIVCRVIAGRVHKPMTENSQELVAGRRSGFDSLAGKLGTNKSHIEELYLLSSTALLPCFVIVCKS